MPGPTRHVVMPRPTRRVVMPGPTHYLVMPGQTRHPWIAGAETPDLIQGRNDRPGGPTATASYRRA